MKDIKVKNKTNDIVFENTDDLKAYQFSFIDEDELYVYGEIIVPFTYNSANIYSEGLAVVIPYRPTEKPLKVCVKKNIDGESFVNIMNPSNNLIWFDVYKPDLSSINICEYITVNYKFNYKLLFNDFGKCLVYSSQLSDLKITDALKQNKDMLIQCIPSSNYRYPTSGVGLVKYLHSNITHTDLASRIISEFADDGMNVTKATFNEDTNELYIETT